MLPGRVEAETPRPGNCVASHVESYQRYPRAEGQSRRKLTIVNCFNLVYEAIILSLDAAWLPEPTMFSVGWGKQRTSPAAGCSCHGAGWFAARR